MNTDLYHRQNILQHYKNPHNYGVLDDSSVSATATNSSCGDEVTVSLQIKDNIVREAKFQGAGCVISTATTSILTDYLKGKTIAEIQKIDRNKLMELLGIEVSPSRLKCLLIGLEATHKAILAVKSQS